MSKKIIENKVFDEIEVGDTASVSKKLTKKDIILFAYASGDLNPSHLDSEFAKENIFKKPVAHGIWTGSLISCVLGTKLPGPGTIYLEQKFDFVRPVFIGDKITASVTVIKKQKNRKIIFLDCVCVNQNDKKVLVGKAKVIAPVKKVKRKKVKLPEIIFK